MVVVETIMVKEHWLLETSILDYSIVSQEMVHYVQDFYVQELNRSFSDCHYIAI